MRKISLEGRNTEKVEWVRSGKGRMKGTPKKLHSPPAVFKVMLRAWKIFYAAQFIYFLRGKKMTFGWPG